MNSVNNARQKNQPAWLDGAMEEAWKRANRVIKASKSHESYDKYKNDPIGFVENLLGETMHDELKWIAESVLANPITVAKSSTDVGKTWLSARLGIWFFNSFPGSKVFVAAAPPLENLKQIMWDEIMAVAKKRPTLFSNCRIRNLMITRGPKSFIQGLAIPTSGTAAEREAKFCADADDLFEMYDGGVVKYADLIGRKDVPVVSVDDKFRRKWSFGEFFDNGTQLIYQIKFEDGEVVRRTGNHPLYAGWDIRSDFHKYADLFTHSKGRIRANKEGWLPVSDLREGYAVLCPDSTDFNLGLEQANENVVKFLAYMIGDGCFVGKNNKHNRLQFTQSRNDQLNEFLHVLDNLDVDYSISDSGNYNWVGVSINNVRLINLSKEWGLYNKGSEDKFIPDFVNKLNKEQLSIFLNRLFSTDGWAGVYKAGSYKKAEIGYSSKSRELVFDIQRLLMRFGIRSKIVSKSINSEIYWSLVIWDAVDVINFAEQIGIYGKEENVALALEYSSERLWTYANWKFEKPGYRWKKISSIKIMGQRPTVGVHVPGDNTYLTSLVEHNSGKHSPYLFFIVDEGDAVPDEIYKGIEGCMSGGEMVRLLIMFNPRATNGRVYELEKTRQANVIQLCAFNHPNVITGDNLIPGAVTRDTTLRRINTWTRPLLLSEKIDGDCFEVPDYLLNLTCTGLDGKQYQPLDITTKLRKITEPSFAYMVLGQYPTQSSAQLISEVWIDNAISRWKLYVSQYGENPPEETRAIMSLDIAEYGTDYCAAFLRYGNYVAKALLWTGVDPDETSTRGLKIYKEARAQIVMVDGTGVGAGVAPSMARQGRKDDVRAISVKVSERPSPVIKSELGDFKILRDQIWWAMREWFKSDQAMIPPDGLLKEDLLAVDYEVKNGKIMVTPKEELRRRLKRSPDRGDALALTFAPFSRIRWTRVGEDIVYNH